MHAFSPVSLYGLLSFAGGATLLFLSVVIYRLFFHPLAKFPGPKSAAVTEFYAGYHDALTFESYIRKIRELHDQYGPIVRTRPNELHIRDMDSYNQIFRSGTKFPKDPVYYQFPVVQGSLFNITDPKEAKRRKDMFQPYFSKAAIQRLESDIQGKVHFFVGRLEESGSQDKPADLTLGFRCLTGDVVMDYCYQKPLGALEAPDFQYPLVVAIDEWFSFQPVTWYFQSINKAFIALVEKLPESSKRKYFGVVAASGEILDGCRERILSLKSRTKSSSSSASAPSATPSVFDTMLSPDPSKDQFTPSDDGLTRDAFLMYVAGTDTTGHTLSTGTYHILENPSVLQKFKAELREAIPDRHMMLDWATLETLPYLRGVVEESLRLAYGVPGRLPRVVPASGAEFCGRAIPPGTVVSHSAYVYHNDPAVFPQPDVFDPERWIGDKESVAELDAKMISFSRGMRSCLGMNLALAELYITFAHLFRRLDMELWETGKKEMEWKDCFTPWTRGHLRVKVRPAED